MASMNVCQKEMQLIVNQELQTYLENALSPQMEWSHHHHHSRQLQVMRKIVEWLLKINLFRSVPSHSVPSYECLLGKRNGMVYCNFAARRSVLFWQPCTRCDRCLCSKRNEIKCFSHVPGWPHRRASRPARLTGLCTVTVPWPDFVIFVCFIIVSE